MTDPAPSVPIVVNATPTADQIASAIRTVLLALSTIATTLGAANVSTTLGTLATAAGTVGMVVAFVLSQLHARKEAEKKLAMAVALPDSVAVVKTA